MTIHDYIQVCIDFSHDSAAWGGLDEYQFYTTTGTYWEETCDNAQGGLSVRWAFHCPDEQITRIAPEVYRDLISEQLRVAIDCEWQPDQLEALYELLT